MKLTGLRKNLGDFSLCVDSLFLDSSKPGVYGLIGPNGCGKTTTARLIMGMLSPDAGIIDREGLSRRDMTMLSQKPYMMDDTVYNNLIYPLGLRKRKPNEDIAGVYLDKAGLLSRRKQNARSLSGGEQQKLALARALIFKPKLILADEACADMDIDGMDMFERTVLEGQKTEAITWIIISHQMSQIERLCDFIFFMDQGRLETQGTTKEILDRPENPQVKKYLHTYGNAAGDTYGSAAGDAYGSAMGTETQ
jgi:ABC-type multidrug transport system ATPase subunit